MRGRVIVSWVNPYNENIRQLSIQRAYENKKQFQTIITMPDPTTPQNGFVDLQAPYDSMYYRIFILLDSGKYIFSKPQKPVLDNSFMDDDKKYLSNYKDSPTPGARSYGPEKYIYIKKLDTVIARVPERQFRRYKDSLNYRTRDTIIFESADTLMIRPFFDRNGFRISRFVFTEKEGRVKILLPDAVNKKYSIKFFEEDSTLLFEIKHIQQRLLTLDKSNFIHSGWFKFELYENGELKEKQKLYIPKDF